MYMYIYISSNTYRILYLRILCTHIQLCFFHKRIQLMNSQPERSSEIKATCPWLAVRASSWRRCSRKKKKTIRKSPFGEEKLAKKFGDWIWLLVLGRFDTSVDHAGYKCINQQWTTSPHACFEDHHCGHHDWYHRIKTSLSSWLMLHFSLVIVMRVVYLIAIFSQILWNGYAHHNEPT